MFCPTLPWVGIFLLGCIMGKMVNAALALVMFSGFAVEGAAAQVEEIIVTSGERKRDVQGLPGLVLKRRADNFIQRVNVINDTRDKTLRRSEIMATMRDLVAAAKKSRKVNLAIEGDFTLTPLTAENLDKVSITRYGGRSDTEKISFLIKTPIPSTELAAKAVSLEISQFIKDAQIIGRSEVAAVGSLQISVIDPERYRLEVVKMITDDVNSVTKALNGVYVVNLEGLDEPMYWKRMGFTDMAFYINYSYSIRPGPMK